MKTFAILATGPSMSQALADKVRGRCGAIAVSDAYRLAPWADALVSQDEAWWRHHPEALQFVGAKIGGPRVEIEGVRRTAPEGPISCSTNSGLLAAIVAVRMFGAERVLLLGVDMGGTHFFGSHPEPLKNTSAGRFLVMLDQFARWRPRGVEVLNCTPGSALKCYPFADLDSVLPPAAGRARTSSASRAVRASRPRTAPRSGSGKRRSPNVGA